MSRGRKPGQGSPGPKGQQVLELIRRSIPAAEIAEIVGCQQAWVITIARKHKLPLIRRGDQIEALAKQGMTAGQIAAKLGMKDHAVRMVAKRERITLEPMQKGPKQRIFRHVGWYAASDVTDRYDISKLEPTPVLGPVTINTAGDAAEAAQIERFMRERGVKVCPSAAVGPTQAILHEESTLKVNVSLSHASKARTRGLRRMQRPTTEPSDSGS